MAVPTLAQVFSATRAIIGDDTVAGGEVFTDTILQPHFAKAYRTLYRAMATLGNPKVRREVYYVVPAHTAQLDPSTAGITDFGEPEFLEERGNLTQKTITGATGTTTVSITAVGHGWQTGEIITVNGIVGFNGTEGMWAITVTGVDAFTLNGAIGSGTYSSGGNAVHSGEDFRDMDAADRLEKFPQGEGSSFGKAAWLNDVFIFAPCTQDRQLKITYFASGAAPTSTTASIGIDDSLDFLSTYAAALALGPRNAERAKELLGEALGPKMLADASGGLLWESLNAEVKAQQRIPPDQRRKLPFREPRSFTPTVY
jgi:hypothetical protein